MTSREYFDALRDACARMEVVRRELWRLEDISEAFDERAAGGGGKPSGGYSDPMDRVVVLIDRRKRLSGELVELEAQVGDGLAVIEGVRRGLGDRYADVLDARCVDALSWDDAAFEVGCSKRSAMRRYDTACDWVDAVGLARARAGEGMAES